MSDHILDLSGRQAALRVKLPDGQLYPMVAADEFGVGQLHKFLAEWRKAQSLLAKSDPSEDDVEQMLAILIGLARQIVPDAPKSAIDRMPYGALQRLVEAFSAASPVAAAGEAHPNGAS